MMSKGEAKVCKGTKGGQSECDEGRREKEKGKKGKSGGGKVEDDVMDRGRARLVLGNVVSFCRSREEEEENRTELRHE